MNETWKPVLNYEGLYEVSDLGNVKSCITTQSRRKGLLKPYLKNGYLAVNLYDNTGYKHYYIHRLVASAFITNPNDFKEVNHKDCNKQNNCINNLEWCDRYMNLQHSYEKGLKRTGERHGGHKLTWESVYYIRKNYKKCTVNELCKKFNVSCYCIYNVINGKTWKEVMPNVSDKIVSSSN